MHQNYLLLQFLYCSFLISCAQNWFQNRRAKVKHDEKKHINAALNMQVYAATAGVHSQLPMHQSAYGLEAFGQPFHTTEMDVPVPAFSTDGFAMQDPTAVQQMESNNGYDAIFNASTNIPQQSLSTQDALMQSLSKAGYPIHLAADMPQLMNGISDQVSGNAPFYQGFDTGVDFMSSAEHSADYQNLVANGFGNQQTDTQPYPVGQMDQHTMPTSMSSDLMQSTLIASNEEMKLLDAATAGTTETEVTSALARWADSFSTLGDSTQALEASQQSWASGDQSTATLMHQSVSQDPLNQSPLLFSGDNHALGSQPHRVQSPEGVKNAAIFSPNGKFARRNSSTSALADSLSNVGIDTSQPMSPGFWPSKKPSSIAVRRRRPPLSALGPAALSLPNGEQLAGGGRVNGGIKSATLAASLPLSPNQVGHGQPSAEHKLRRIRSTGLQGGRVQKATSGSAQRSPLHFSFSEASSPRFAKQNGNHLSAMPSGLMTGQSQVAPPTPLSPIDLQREGAGGRMSAGQLRQRGAGDAEVPPAFYTGSTPATAGSPPSTPMGFAPIPPMPHLASAQLFRDTPPQSAPALQQSFPRSVASVPNASTVPEMPSQLRKAATESTTAQIRRPSLPVGSDVASIDPQAAFAVPMVNDDGNLEMRYPLQYREMCFDAAQQSQQPPLAQQRVSQQQHVQQVSDQSHNRQGGVQDVPLAFQKANKAIVSANHAQPSVMPDLMVHEYSPPKVDGQPSPPAPLRNYDGRPKNYTFENAGPENFQASSAR